MKIGNLYTLANNGTFDVKSDVFILTYLESKPPEKGENRDWLPIGFLRNLTTGEELKINHPESIFVPLGDSK
jgi:hypothetical protein